MPHEPFFSVTSLAKRKWALSPGGATAARQYHPHRHLVTPYASRVTAQIHVVALRFCCLQHPFPFAESMAAQSMAAQAYYFGSRICLPVTRS